MRRKKIWNRIFFKTKRDRGTTMVEMVVCFALLGIFMACAVALISSITNIYYSIKGEMVAREVSDIIMEKIVSEIDGAEYFGTTGLNADDNPKVSVNQIELIDKTDTHVSLKMKDGKMVVHYYEILVDGSEDSPGSRVETDWTFDDNLYKGFYLTGLSFYRGGGTTPAGLEEYGLGGVNLSNYPSNVVLVLMKMNNGKYDGEYHFYRFIRMYNVPENSTG